MLRRKSPTEADALVSLRPPAPVSKAFWASVVALYGLALVSFGLLARTNYASFGATPFANHMTLMPASFTMMGVFGATAFRLFRDALGLRHESAKAVHGTLMCAAAVTGVAGIWQIWADHDKNAAAMASKFGAAHLQSLHSWVGLAAITLFLTNAVGGLLVFLLAPKQLRAAYRPLHVFAGSVAVCATVAAVMLGIVSNDGRGDGDARNAGKHLAYRCAGLLVLGLGAALAGVVASSPPRRRE